MKAQIPQASTYLYKLYERDGELCAKVRDKDRHKHFHQTRTTLEKHCSSTDLTEDDKLALDAQMYDVLRGK